MTQSPSTISQIMEENRQLKARLEASSKEPVRKEGSSSDGISGEVRASLKEKYAKLVE